jgi:prepilin-type processing-associated H-X9-DG protein
MKKINFDYQCDPILSFPVNLPISCNFCNEKSFRVGFTLVEFLTVITIIGMLLAILLPAVQFVREAAHRLKCSSNMKQFTLAFQNYHDVNSTFPGVSSILSQNNRPRFNCHAVLLPFLEQTPLYEKFQTSNQLPWEEFSNILLPFFLCPSDPYCTYNGADQSKRANIVVSIGDFPQYTMNSRGIISSSKKEDTSAGEEVGKFPFSWRNVYDVTDGLSNTIFCSEVSGTRSNTDRNVLGGVYPYDDSSFEALVNSSGEYIPSNCYNNSRSPSNNAYLRDRNSNVRRTYHQFDNAQGYQIFNTITPPNSPACVIDNTGTDHCWGLYPPQSYHTNGVNAGFGDGSVRFINESIDTNNLPNGKWYGGTDPDSCFTGVSPFGVWGALGTINSGD